MIIGLFAIDNDNGIGFKGGLPWPHNKDDMAWFRSITRDQVVVMGKKTWNSPDMPKPLPNRVNVVITNNFENNLNIQQIKGQVPGSLVSTQCKYPDKNIFVIGGENILTQAIPVLEKLYVTRIPGKYESDVKLNLENFLKNFKIQNTLDLGSCKVEEYKNEAIY